MRTYLAIGLICALSSCSPEYTVARYGVKARLINAETKQPLKRVKTRIVVDRKEFTRTSGRDGLVEVAPDLDWHISWLGGPVWMGRSGANIGMEAEGYREKSFKWLRGLPSADALFSEERGVVDLGIVELERR
jgi:hypothetical protein